MELILKVHGLHCDPGKDVLGANRIRHSDNHYGGEHGDNQFLAVLRQVNGIAVIQE
jgi:hypothetical protein